MPDNHEDPGDRLLAEAEAAIERARRVLAEEKLDTWLTSISEHSEQLELAPETDQDTAIEQRRLSGTHLCAHCGEAAAVAFIVGTEAGVRWLDLCAPHGVAVREALLSWDDEEA